MTQSSRAVPETGVDSGVASASVRPEPSSVESMAPLVAELRALADCDSRAGEPLGKCMRKAADKIERLSEHADYIEAQWLAKAGALSAKDRELAEALAGYALVAKHNAEIEAEHEETFAKLTTAERERDEALAALREKEEARVSLSRSLNHAAKVQVELEDRVKALEEALGPFARADRALGDTSGSDRTFRLETDTGYREISRNDFRRARSVLSSVQPVSGSREQRGNEEG